MARDVIKTRRRRRNESLRIAMMNGGTDLTTNPLLQTFLSSAAPEVRRESNVGIESKVRFLDLNVALSFRDVRVEIWIDCFDGCRRSREAKTQGGDGAKEEVVFRCLFLLEPEIVSGAGRRVLTEDGLSLRFDAIFTHDPTLLSSFPTQKTYLFEHGGTWIVSERIVTDPIEASRLLRSKVEGMGISFVCGDKTATEGHRLRRALWMRQRSIRGRRAFYISGAAGKSVPKVDDNAILDARPESKHRLFGDTVAAHVCIENVRQDNYFSEKLIDCLLTRTVPIYWGCPNISNYFNTAGMIIVGDRPSADIEDVGKEMVEKTNAITPELVRSMRGAIEENFKRARRWIDLDARMQDAIETALCVRDIHTPDERTAKQRGGVKESLSRSRVGS